MGFWETFWAILILFSLVSFTYMSIKIVYKGLDELKYMLLSIKNENFFSKK